MACLSLPQLPVSMQSEMAEDGLPEDIRAYTVNGTDSNANRFIDQAQEEVAKRCLKTNYTLKMNYLSCVV